MSSWKAAEDGMSDDLTDEFAEPIRHQPMIMRPNERPCVDPARPLQTMSARNAMQPLRGIFENQAKEISPIQSHERQTRDSSFVTQQSRISTRKPDLSIDVRDFASDIRVGDLIAIVERGLLFEVRDQQPDGQGRVCLKLSQHGRDEAGL